MSTSAGGIVEQTPTIGTPDVAPNNDLVVRFPSVTGGTGDNDVEVVFQYFAPDLDASGQDVLDPITGNDVPTTNDGRVTGSWTPTDPSDSVAAINVVDQSSLTDNHVLDLKSIAIQKSSQIINDVGMVGVSPGDTVEYTLQFQISDYFTFGDLIIEDILSDGQRLTGSPTGPFTDPFTLDVTDRNGNVTGSFSPSLTNGATNLFVDLSQIGNDTNPATDGSTRLVFDVSRALTDLGAADGILQGGRAILPDAGGATGVITYRTVIQQSFSDTYPSGESNVDQGDILENNVTISGTIRSNSAIATTVGVEEDTSAEVLEVLGGKVIKTTYAVNGTLGPVDSTVDPDTGLVRGPSYANTLQVRPGDVVTYRLRYAMPSADIENLLITDFLPLPVYDATIISTTFGTTVDGTAPSADSAKYGPDHTFSRVPLSGPPTQHPTMTTSAVDNNVVFDFGSFNEPPPEGPRVVDILLSVTISDEPMADGLLLTNQFEASHGTTNAGTLASDSITQITLTEPELEIRKAAVSSDNPNATFSSTVAPTGVSFEAPGLNTPANSFAGGTIHSTNLGNTINSNISRVDADDLVKFAIVVENTGSSSAGAFDVAIRDTLPAGFAIPATGPGLNLELFDGAGNAMPFTSLGSGLFDPAGGIQLNDPGATPATSIGSPPVTVNAGALDEFDPTDGNNILVLTYDLQVVANVAPGQTANLQNTATVFNYAGSEGGPDHTNPTDLTDNAQTTIGMPVVSKQLIDTSVVNANNANNQAVIGEIVTYELQVTIPEGSTPNAVIQDTLDNGLAFVDVVSFSASPALTIANPIGTGTAPANTTITNSGGTLGFNLGNITNSDRTNTTSETITIRYRAVVLNQSSNQSAPATALNNSVRIIWTGGNVARVGAPTVSVIEPLLDVNKTVSSATADAFNSLRYT
ncbi:MAG: isopeptide-forming domain-containing fimbrial protein, partial [Planctomycetales bacterium]|nr:isopeptide-forming domain-containing fimbrial protein [Planctomycetales bacterium]